MQLKPRTQQGFTLVEVMVTVFVVAIGLLAAAALQAVSKKAAVDAIQRTTATVVAQEMIERIRANPILMSQYDGNVGSAPPQPACGSSSNCTDTDLIAYDRYSWWQNLEGAAEKINIGGTATETAGGLRNPKGCVRVSGNLVEVVVVWRGMSKITQGAETGDTEDPTGDACFNTDESPNDFDLVGGQSYRRVLRIRAHIAT